MQLLLRTSILFTFLLLSLHSTAYSQYNATPLEPEKLPGQQELGIVFGLGQNWLNGAIYPDCPTCKFENGQKFAWNFGLVYTHDITKNIQWGALATYDYLGVKSLYRTIESVRVKNPNDKSNDYVNASFRYTGEFDFSAITLTPFIQWQFMDNFFTRLGFDVSYIISSNLKNSKELLQNHGINNSGDSVDIYLVDKDSNIVASNILVLENKAFPNINKFQLYVDPMIGFNFNFDDYTYMNIYYQMAIPLTKISSTQEGFNINRWRIMFELRYALKVRH